MINGAVDSLTSKRKRKSKLNQNKITKESKSLQIKTEESKGINKKNTEKILDMQGEIHQESVTKDSEISEPVDSESVQLQDDVNAKHVENTVTNMDEPLENNSSSCIINVENSDNLPSSIVETALDAVDKNASFTVDTCTSLSNYSTRGIEKLDKTGDPQLSSQDYVNPQGVRFTSEISELENENQGKLLPYGLGCIRELFRFLISLCNPLDKQNNKMMIHSGLTLLGVAFEIGADAIGKHESLLVMVKDELCRNLFSVSVNFFFLFE